METIESRQSSATCVENKKRLSVDALVQVQSRRDSSSASRSTPSRQASQHLSRNFNNSAPMSAVPSSEQSPADSAVQFLERRRSNDANSLSQRRQSYYNQIQPDLYRRRGSIISIASFSSTQSTSPTLATTATSGAPSANSEKTRSPRVGAAIVGNAQLQLSYDFPKSDFVVQLVEAFIQPSLLQLDDCKLQMSLRFVDAPENGSPIVMKRQVVEKTNIDGHITAHGERFKFAMSYEELLQQVLTMEVVSVRQNLESPARFVSHARTSVALSLLNPSDDELLIWLDLEAVKEVETNCGKLNLCLQFLPSAARLTITIHRATNLPVKPDRLSNTLVRASLIQDDKVILKKRKTNTCKASSSPSWNEVLTFGVTPSVIARCRLEVSVMECDRFGNNSRPIGRINFSSSKPVQGGSNAANGVSVVHIWRETVEGRNVALSQWFSLEPTPPPTNTVA